MELSTFYYYYYYYSTTTTTIFAAAAAAFAVVFLPCYAMSSIAGIKMIPFASYKAPQTQSRLPSPTK